MRGYSRAGGARLRAAPLKEAVGTGNKRQEESLAWFYAWMGGMPQAARRVGLEEEVALELLQKPRVCDKVEGHKKALESRARGDAVRALLRLATYSGLDAVTLAVRGESLTREDLERLDFAGVSSFKYAPGGGCEVKFFDPARAAELLLEMGEQKSAGPEGFYQALRESAALVGESGSEESRGAGEDDGGG